MKPAYATAGQRAHDYAFLVERWRAVAKACGLVMKPWVTVSGHRVYVVRSKGRQTGGLYISAGIHGDEPAGPEALITWAERNRARLRRLPCLIFPCLNPWGLLNNSRRTEEGRDLNRAFRDDSVELVARWKSLLSRRLFDVALCLHEDYDALGSYIYEPVVAEPHWGEDLVALSPPDLPIDRRRDIEGRAARGGVVRVSIDPGQFPELPEAAHLHRQYARRNFTFETPSEFDLGKRVAVQIRVIEECVRRLGKEALPKHRENISWRQR